MHPKYMLDRKKMKIIILGGYIFYVYVPIIRTFGTSKVPRTSNLRDSNVF